MSKEIQLKPRVLLVATVAVPKMCEGCRFYRSSGCGSMYWGKNLPECPVKVKGEFQCPGGKCYDCNNCESTEQPRKEVN